MTEKSEKTQLTVAWKERARAALEASGRTLREVADELGCSHAAIVQVLDPKEGQQTSKLAVPLSKLLGIAPPTVEVGGDVDRAWLEAGRRLAAANPTEAAAVLEIVQAFVANAEQKRAVETEESALIQRLRDLLHRPK